MNFRRLVSAVAALAVAGTMCAGLAVTASAEAASATLVHLASQYVASGTKRDWSYTIDESTATIGRLDCGQTVAGIGYAQFTLPEISSGYTVTNAVLNFDVSGITNPNDARVIQVCPVDGFYVSEDGTAISHWDTAGAGQGNEVTLNTTYAVTNSTTKSSATANLDFDMVAAVKNAYSDGDSDITFAIGFSSANVQAKISNPTLTITYTAATVYEYAVYAVDGSGNKIATIAENQTTETDLTVNGISEVIQGEDGTYYRLNDSDVTNYAKSFTISQTGEEFSVTYKSDSSIVYFDDAGSATWPYTEDTSTCSGGNAGSWGSGKNAASIDVTSGIYVVTIKVAAKAGSGSSYRKEAVALDGTQVDAIEDNATGVFNLDVTVTGDSGTITVYGLGTSMATDWIDYILITDVTPEIESVEVTTATAANSSPAPTDLTGVGVSDTTLTGSESVTTYLIKVANYTTTLGNPTLVTTSGALQPSESTIEYGYSSGGYKYFVIQTIGIDKASSVQLDSCEDYDL